MAKWCIALLLLTGVAFAGDIGVNFTAPGVQNGSSVWNLGYYFTANTNATVAGLGVFDYNQDGFAQPQQVGLWDVGTSALLASTYVDNNDPLNGFWRFHGISGVTLVAGREYVVGSQGGEGYTYYTSGMTVAPEITFIEDAWIYLGNSSNDPLFEPNTTDGIGLGAGGGFFGGNVEFTPEPGTLALAGPALLGLFGLARRRFHA